jgi:hypothetical protein
VIRFGIFETFFFEAPRLDAEVHRGRVEKAAHRGRYNTLTSIFVAIKPIKLKTIIVRSNKKVSILANYQTSTDISKTIF